MKKFIKNSLFLLILSSLVYYILVIKTEKYESSSIIRIKDLSTQQTTTPFGAMLLTGASSVVQDNRLLMLYIKSGDMFSLLNQEFNLTNYYSGEEIDVYNRLYKETPLSNRKLNGKNLISMYQNDLKLQFDEPSSTLLIKFAHANAKTAQQIVQRIIVHATVMLNSMEKKSSKIVLTFLKQLEREKYKLFLTSQKNLLLYQNRHHSISPQIEVERKSGILATLEGELIQKEVLFKSKSQYLNKNAPEMKLLKGDISSIKATIKKIKKEMTGESKDRGKLNRELADFEQLKSEVEFNKEIYRETLSKLEESSIMVSQNSKNLIIISKANVSDSYAYPNKFKEILTLITFLTLLFGIAGLIGNIIRDHKD